MRSINRCLNNQLSSICQQALQLETLDKLIQCYLPKPLSEHCQVASFNKGCLTLSAANATWATELRYSLPSLRDQLRQEAGLHQLSSIKIALANLEVTREYLSKKSNKARLSSNAASIIRRAGDDCEYPPLKRALYELASQELKETL